MDVITFLVLALMPTVEPRYAVALAILSGWDSLSAFSLGALAVFLLSGALVIALAAVDQIFLNIPRFGKLWRKYRTKVKQRAGRYVNRWGPVGLVLFVAVPFPGTGIYTGALAAYLLGMDLKRAWLALIVGGVVSSIITLLLALSGHVLLLSL